MKLALFSQNVTKEHIVKLKTFFNKPLEEVRFLYINTAGNYKPYKSDWMVKGEQKWRDIFPKFQEFDLERAFRVDQHFDFETFLGSYDFIFVGGGTTYLVSYWMKKTGSREIAKKLIENNKIVYGGESAGAIYAYKEIDSYKELDYPDRALEKIDEGLNVIPFAPIPHWQNEEFQVGLENIRNNLEKNGVQNRTMTDDQAIFVVDSEVSVI